jgi:hypothetical protein
MAKYKIHFTKGPDIWVKYVDEVTNSNEAVLVCVMENKDVPIDAEVQLIELICE